MPQTSSSQAVKSGLFARELTQWRLFNLNEKSKKLHRVVA
jgi:hypothetical protein